MEPLTKEETGAVVDKTKALMLHRIGDMARLQTDAIIISSCLGVVWVGLIGTYKMIVNSVSGYVNLIFNSVISSFGNLIATESREKQFQLFLVYRFLQSGYTDFRLWDFPAPVSSRGAVCRSGSRVGNLDYRLVSDGLFLQGGARRAFKFQDGGWCFEQDKYLSILQGIVNLVLSIALVFKIGLAGVFIGTVVSGLIANITKPIIIYRVCFEKSAFSYFQESIKYLLVIGAALAVLIPLQNLLMPQVTIAKFALMIVIITVVFNGIFWSCSAGRRNLSICTEW